MTHQRKNLGQVENPGNERCAIRAIAVACLMLFGSVVMQAQTPTNPPGTTSAPVVDSSTTGPTTPPANPLATDAAVEASPMPNTVHGVSLPPHAEVAVRLQKAIDSANVRNGDMLDAVLASPVRTSGGHMLPAGTRVGVTVLAVAAAGKISSRGEVTLQVVHVGPAATITDALTFHGQPGHKDLADSAPTKGTEASVSTSTTLRFHVPPIPK